MTPLTPQAWDGTAAEFMTALERVRAGTDTEGDNAVLAEVLAFATSALGMRGHIESIAQGFAKHTIELEARIAALTSAVSRANGTFASLDALRNAWHLAAQSVNDPKSPSIYIECAEQLEDALEPRCARCDARAVTAGGPNDEHLCAKHADEVLMVKCPDCGAMFERDSSALLFHECPKAPKGQAT